MIDEKTDRFTPGDVAGNLVVLMLMLPSASRQNKETLKVFKDSGDFGASFPKDDDVRGQTKLLECFQTWMCLVTLTQQDNLLLHMQQKVVVADWLVCFHVR